MNKKLILLIITCILICQIRVFAQEDIVYDDKDNRNPFIALVTPDGRLISLEPTTEAEAKIVLEGIISGASGRSYAIINGEVLGLGDYILGYAVFKIEKNKVVLFKDNELIEYKLE